MKIREILSFIRGFVSSIKIFVDLSYESGRKPSNGGDLEVDSISVAPGASFSLIYYKIYQGLFLLIFPTGECKRTPYSRPLIEAVIIK